MPEPVGERTSASLPCSSRGMVSRCTWVKVASPILRSCPCRYWSSGSASKRSALKAAFSRLPSSAGVRGSAAALAGSSFRTAPLCVGSWCAAFCS